MQSNYKELSFNYVCVIGRLKSLKFAVYWIVAPFTLVAVYRL